MTNHYGDADSQRRSVSIDDIKLGTELACLAYLDDTHETIDHEVPMVTKVFGEAVAGRPLTELLSERGYEVDKIFNWPEAPGFIAHKDGEVMFASRGSTGLSDMPCNLNVYQVPFRPQEDRKQLCACDSLLFCSCNWTDGPGVYRVVHRIAVQSAVDHDAPDIDTLPPGCVVKATRVVNLDSARKLRMYIEQPAGWISSVDMDTGFRWVEKDTSQACTCNAWIFCTCNQADGPGFYRILQNVSVQHAVDMASPELATIEVGCVVKAIEVVHLEDARTIRIKIEEPAGWISLLDLENGICWAARETSNSVATTLEPTDQTKPLDHSVETHAESCVHRGHYNMLLSLLSGVDTHMLPYILDPKPKRFVFAGHSRGGSIALGVFAYLLQNMSLAWKQHEVILVTLGAPRFGNAAFQSWLEARMSATLADRCMYLRVVNGNDLVPSLPQEYFGYCHAGILCQMTSEGTCLIDPEEGVEVTASDMLEDHEPYNYHNAVFKASRLQSSQS